MSAREVGGGIRVLGGVPGESQRCSSTASMRGGSGGGVGGNEVGDGGVKVDNQGEVREQWEGISIDEGRTRPPMGGLGRRRRWCYELI